MIFLQTCSRPASFKQRGKTMANVRELIEKIVNNEQVPEDIKKQLKEAKIADLESGEYVSKGKHLDQLEKVKNENAKTILELQEQLEAQKAGLEKFKDVDLERYNSFDSEKAKLLKNHELDIALIGSGVQDLKSAKVHFENLDDISDINKSVAKLKESKPFLFAGEKVRVPDVKESKAITDDAEKKMRKAAGLPVDTK